jgi:UDP-GlcNAc:undecaprenyl-phosphate GlcNAc-1-phosphate transferase
VISFPYTIYALAFLGSFAVSALSLPFWRSFCRRVGLVDDPGHRKIHNEPVALAGGLAIFTGLVVSILCGAIALKAHWLTTSAGELLSYGLMKRWPQLSGIIGGATGMLVIGLADDKWELRPAVKFGGQFLCALLVAASGVRITLFVHNAAFSNAATVIWILTVTNACNFMDNMNGLCGGIGAIGSWCLGLFAASQGQYLVATIAFLIAGALTGFLPFNFPKASSFLGDAGSHLVGYLLAVLAILPHFFKGQTPRTTVLLPLLVLAIPLLDLISVVLIRWKIGQPFWIGDNNHFSHRLVRRGYSKTTAVLLLWLGAAVAGTLALRLAN